MIKGKLEGKKGAALADLAARLGDLDARQERAQAEGVPALRRLVAVAQCDTGQSRIVGRFLLGLWNGSAYGFDLTELRGLDTALHDDCLAVLRLDHTPAREVHSGRRSLAARVLAANRLKRNIPHSRKTAWPEAWKHVARIVVTLTRWPAPQRDSGARNAKTARSRTDRGIRR